MVYFKITEIDNLDQKNVMVQRQKNKDDDEQAPEPAPEPLNRIELLTKWSLYIPATVQVTCKACYYFP